MTNTPTQDFRFTRDVPAAVWLTIAAVIIAIAMIVQAVFPRYEFRVVGEDGRALVIYDRWGGQFQRANYDDKGQPTLTPIVTPF